MTLPDDPDYLGRLEAELQTYRNDILRYLRRGLSSELQRVFDAEDVLQDVYFDAAVGLKNFRADDELSPRKWIFTIARNRLARLRRDQAALKRRSVSIGESDLGLGELIIMLDELAIYTKTPSKSAMGRETAIMVDRAVTALPHDYASAIRLRYLDGKSVKETASLMERSERAVHMLCFRALKELRIALQGISL